jgi:carbon-monoxide dehydrogenase medium subunit
VIPAEFDYKRPTTLKEATALLAESPDAKVLAGGMSLIPAVKHRLLQPELLVDIGAIPELDRIQEKRGRITIGARVTHAALTNAPEAVDAPILGEAATLIGDPQVRNRGTFGGSLVHADPAADWPAVFLALDGEAVVVGPRGERAIRAGDFFAGMLTSALEPDEVLTEVRLQVARKRAGTAYAKLRQAASGFAVVGVAVQLETDRRGRCERVAIGITGVNPVPLRAASVEARLSGVALDDAVIDTALASIDELDPMADIHASADYRRALARVYTARALRTAYGRARA